MKNFLLLVVFTLATGLLVVATAVPPHPHPAPMVEYIPYP